MKSLFIFYLLAIFLGMFTIAKSLPSRQEQIEILQKVLDGQIDILDVDPELFALPHREIHRRG